MSRYKVSAHHTGARLTAALLLGTSLIVGVLPTTHADQRDDARPRRVTAQPPRTRTTTATTPPDQSPTNQQPPQRQTTPPVKPQPTPPPATTGGVAPPVLQTKPTAGAPNAQASEQEQSSQEIDPDEIVTIDSNLTTLNVRVIDRQNRPVDNVKQEEFRVFEDGAPQKVEFFTKEEVPISYGLVIDNSGSLRFQITQVIDAGKTIVNSNKPGDETFLVRFVSNDKIEVVQDFTAIQDDLLDGLDNLYTEGGQTAVIDAVYLSAERVSSYKKNDDLNDRRRRALILVTDGEDRASHYKQEELFAELRENDVQIYVIGFVNELDATSGLIRKSSKEKAVNLLTKLAEQTGGRAFFPNSTSELPQIAQDITKDLRTQYVVGYYPTNKTRDGSFRAVRVQLADAGKKSDKRIAITRSGYTARRDGGGPAASSRPAKERTTNKP